LPVCRALLSDSQQMPLNLQQPQLQLTFETAENA
jgi:hypothetical protein